MYFSDYANRNISTVTPLLRHCTLFDIDKDISFKGSRSYEIPQYQITKTPVPNNLHRKGYWITG